MLDKLYVVTDVSINDMLIRAVETHESIVNLSENEMFDFFELQDFRLQLINNGGQADIVNFEEWLKK